MSAEGQGEKTASSAAELADLDRLHWGSIRDWAQLVRLPTVFTLLSNCAAATVLAGSVFTPLRGVIPVFLVSIMAYWAGMILNDVADIDEDKQYRPTRPLAAGRISPTVAGHVAKAMLLLGPATILGVTSIMTAQPLWLGMAFFSAVLLSICIWAYNSPLKKTGIGPVLMGACRGLNILMVGSTLFSLGEETRFPSALLVFAAGIAVYIMGVTFYARKEETDSDSQTLVFGLMLEVAGLMVVASLPRWVEADDMQWTLDPMRGYPLLIGLIGLTVVNRGIKGISHPVPRKVQLAVKHALLTLILVDASIVLMWVGPVYAVCVVILLLPALISALRIRST